MSLISYSGEFLRLVYKGIEFNADVWRKDKSIELKGCKLKPVCYLPKSKKHNNFYVLSSLITLKCMSLDYDDFYAKCRAGGALRTDIFFSNRAC